MTTFQGADVDALRQLQDKVRRSGDRMMQVGGDALGLSFAVPWGGGDAEAFRSRCSRTLVDLDHLIAELRVQANVLAAQADEQDHASRAAGHTDAQNPTSAVWPLVIPVDVSGPLPSPAPSPSPQPPTPDVDPDSRDPDGRDGLRVDRDERGRDREGNGHFSHDWAGRAILDRYLSGGGDWILDNDPTWTEYMKDHAEENQSDDGLGNRVRQLNEDAARDALDRYLEDGQTSSSHSETTDAALDNGEGMVGSQYLHGSNADAGGFEYEAESTVVDNGDGTYTVTLDPEYTFNDRIDPNPEYTTDTLKSTLAEIMTFGRADPYDIHISWGDPVEIVVDADGNPVSQKGWPF